MGRTLQLSCSTGDPGPAWTHARASVHVRNRACVPRNSTPGLHNGAILAKLGYHVVASTGRPDELGGALRALGAADVIGRLEHDASRPLGKQRWAGVVDAVGGGALAQSISETKYRGAVASTGVAAGGELHMTL